MTSAFICDAVRTPVGRYAGALSAVRADDLGAVPMAALMQRRAGVDWGALDDVFYGCANQSGEDNRNVARMSLLLAGLPTTVSGVTVNRLCGSGMEAVALAARAVRCGEMHLAIAGGVESMSRAPFVLPKSDTAFGRNLELHDTTLGWRFVNPRLHELHGTDSMPQTGENVAREYRVSRADQDAFALRSQQRAAAAKAAGVFAEEIVAVPVPQRRGDPLPVSEDEHLRPDTTAQALARLKPLFGPDGSVTAGNASGLNDGACALIVASEQSASRYGLTPRARVIATATAGVPPRVMGMGPAPATRRALALAHVPLAQIDVVELNEAFASQALAVLRELGLPDDAGHVNPNGGAIALGHPLGMSGARIVAAAVNELHRRDARYALATMCIGVGQGIAMVLEKV